MEGAAGVWVVFGGGWGGVTGLGVGGSGVCSVVGNQVSSSRNGLGLMSLRKVPSGR